MPPILRTISIDETNWSAASRERRHEWRLAIQEILEEHRLELDGAAVPLDLLITYADGHAHLDAATPDGALLAQIDVPRDRLAPHLDEYFDICRKMIKLGQSSQAAQFEALDIAKRIAHDEAAETLAALCRPLRPDHGTCRRLFTLLVALHFDTTRLALPHHRR